MGMDVIGKSNKEAYFRSNVWGWRPIHAIIDYINDKHDLGIDTENFGFNDGSGVDDAETCKLLSKLIKENLDGLGLTESDDIIYLAIGPNWVKYGSGEFISKELSEKMDLEVYSGKILTGPVIVEGGEMIVPSYSTDREMLIKFCNFLNVCGGFEIH